MTLPYILRPMTLDDIPQVVRIDELSFPTPWSIRTYRFEINNRDSSHLVVLELPGQETNEKSVLQRLFMHLHITPPVAAAQHAIVGYGGCWLIAGEAHISTIAVHPGFRGRGLGELLLAGMLRRAIRLNGQYSILEVRVSNVTAQALYRKYEYEIVGRRKNYYRDNGEDAFLMEVRPLDAAYKQRFTRRFDDLCNRIHFIDRFTS